MNPSGIEIGSASQTQKKWKKKKSPSDKKRDALRKARHLEQKNLETPPVQLLSTEVSKSQDPPNSADLSNLSLISEAPMILEDSEAMTTEPSDQQ